MSLVRRSIFLATAIVATVIGGVLFFVFNDHKVLQEMRRQSVVARETLFDNALRMKGDSLRKALEDYTSWAEMVDYTAMPTRTWAKNNIDSILNTYKADGYWVFDPTGKLLGSVLRAGDKERENQAFPGKLPDFHGQIILPQQFFSTTNTGLMEVFCSSIHAVADPQRSGVVHGYFLFARQVDATYLQELSAFTGWQIELLSRTEQRDSAFVNDDLLLRRVVTDLAGSPVGVLQARTSLPEINRLERHNRLHRLAGLAFVAVFIGALLQLIKYQRTLRRAKKNLDEVQQLAKMGSWERDIATGAGFWSDNSFRLFGLQPRRAAPGLNELFSLLHEGDRERLRASLSTAMATGSNYDVEFRLANDPAGRVFRSSGTALCNEAGKPVRMVGSIQDITEKRQQELAKDQLLKQREMFIARLSHDIKTPLTPLVALLPQIRRRIADEKLAGLLDICLDNVNHMKALVVKTIKLALYSSPGQMQLEEMATLPLAEVVAEYVRKRADILESAQMQTEIAIDPDLTVKADQLDLEEVFYNLISNAVKYSPPGARLVITATAQDRQVLICVQDNGVGLTAAELPHIFDEFFKADQSRHELDSSGLGLSICKRIVENHGGRIWAESAGKGCGTTICFTIQSGGNHE